MRAFWHFITAIAFIGILTFLFFAFSLRADHRIAFTDDLPELTEPTVTIADPSIGPKEALVTIVNFGDYQCDSCQTLDEALTELRDDYQDEVRLVWKDMPNPSVHDEALNAAVAARCAGEQDKFFEYHAYLFANQESLNSELYPAIAEELGLKETKFKNCFEQQDTLPLVERSYEEGLALDVAATPTIFINGERYTGNITVLELRQAVEAALRAL